MGNKRVFERKDNAWLITNVTGKTVHGDYRRLMKAAFEAWAEDYNKNYLHSTLGYKTPEQFEAEYKTSRATQLDAA